MKSNRLLKRLLSFVGVLVMSMIVAGQSAKAAAPVVTGSAGDLILGFRDTSGTNANDLEVDLGQASQFATWASSSPGVTFNLNLGGAVYGSNRGLSAADLRYVFGSGTSNSSWNTLSTLVWSVAGKTGATSTTTLFATFPTGTVVNRASGTTQNTPGGRLSTLLSSLEGQPSLSGTNSGGSPEAAEIAADPTSNTNYTGAIRGNATANKDYGYFTPSTETNVVSTGFASLDLYEFAPSSTSGVPGTDLGTFNLGSDGTFTFTAEAVPEPSTYAALVLGAGVLLFAGRHPSRNSAKR